MSTAQRKIAPNRIVQANVNGITQAVSLLHEGGLVGIPTETVYGLAADAANATAVAKIYAAKGRPQFNPLIAHVASIEMAKKLGRFSKAAEKLVSAFWPGPLTLVVPYIGGEAISDLARAGLETIALRMPDHTVMQQVLKQFGGVLVAPSANRSGHVSATDAQHVADDLGDAVDLILNDGATALGLESTVVDLSSEKPTLLRQGALTRDRLEAVIGGKLRMKVSYDPENPSSPGQLSAHYAPTTPLRMNATTVEDDEALLAFGAPLIAPHSVIKNLSLKADLQEAATHFFAYLRELDQVKAKRIAVMPIPDEGLGEAMNDRLRRAAIGSNA